MNDTQIALTADLIIESFWYLKLEEIKYCFRRAMRTAKLFDRLDGNIILGWLRDYNTERTEEAMRLSDQEASQMQFEYKPSVNAISWETYVSRLWGLAYYADPEAVEKLSDILDLEHKCPELMTAEEKHRDKLEFRQFYYQYIKDKK